MWALYLAAGLICGAGITYVILYLLSRRGKESPAAAPVSDQELETNSEAVGAVCLASLGGEKALEDREIASFETEDEAAEKDRCGHCAECGSLACCEEKAAAGEVVADDAEAALIIAEAEKERAAFVKAKKGGGVIVVPQLRFTLSREDVLDRADDMKKALLAAGEEAVLPNVVYRKKNHFCDSLHCGEWCFALMYERANVIKLTLRLDKATAERLAAKYTAFRPALFPKGEFWYDLIVDSSFESKREVYDILDDAYAFVLGKYYRKENNRYITDILAAQNDGAEIVAVTEENAETPDPLYDTAIAEYDEALLKYRQKNKLPFRMTRMRLLRFAQRSMSEDGGEVIVRLKRCLPASLRANGKTYALAYEKLYGGGCAPEAGVNSYVSLTVRISDAYAAWLALRHPEVCRARFPKNRNWYVVPVDGSFKSAQMVYRVLKHAKKFILQ